MCSLNIYNNKLILKSLLIYSKIFPIQNISLFKNEICITILNEYLKFVILFLKLNTFLQYKILSSITGVDFLYNKARFEINYDLLSIRFNNRLRIKIFINELDTVHSCESVHLSSNWYECELWDMFGIFFLEHSNLKRILTDYGFSGNPLRKDFPLSGFIEIRYSENKKKILSEPLELSQEYRTFNYTNPWDF